MKRIPRRVYWVSLALIGAGLASAAGLDWLSSLFLQASALG